MNAQATKTRSTRSATRRRLNETLDRGVGVALQSIIDLDDGEIIGVEAPARFPDGRPPTEWFAEAASLGLPVEDYPALSTALQGLRSRGMRVAVDDAGAGFSSMQHVLRLRPDVIKLDVSIVRGMDSQPDRRAFVSSLVSFARATGCSLVAEAIESAGELETARALGVGCAQGFHLGTPEAAGPARWQVTLPRRRLAARVRSGKISRYVRPASLLLAAALSWPGIVAVAGLGGRSAGGLVEKLPATASRSGSGGSGASKTVPLPAAAHTPAAKPVSGSSVALPAVRPSVEPALPAKRTGPATNVLDGVLGTPEGDAGLVGGLLRRVLGRR